MQQTGYWIVDGDPARGIPPATPRHWVLCAAFVIVAQWVLSVVNAATGVLTMTTYAWIERWAAPFAYVAWLIFPFATVAALTVWLSTRFDGRGLAALGIRLKALAEGPPWIMAGFVAAGLTIAGFFLLPPGWPSLALEGALWLTPATMIQAGAEEILFRGALLSILVARYGAGSGALLSAALFALWHLYVGQPIIDAAVVALSTFVFGVTTAILVLHQGHLGGAIALHVVWNVIVGVDQGLGGWADMGGASFGASNTFWPAYFAGAGAPWTLADLQTPERTREAFFPVILETMIVFAVCRSTFERIINTWGRRSVGSAPQAETVD